MAYTTVNKSSDYFNNKLYTGNGSTQTISGVGHQPDLVWVKQRNGAAYHQLTDVLRGVNSQSASNDTGLGASNACVTAFNSDGFALGSNGDVNGNTLTYASWNWKANGTGSANTAGSINSTVSVNTTSRFSIVKWAGSGSLATIGHGLGVVPKMIICKSVVDGGWGTYHEATGNGRGLFLNITGVGGTDVAYWNNTSPTSSVFTVNFDGGTNREGGSDMIAYCFADVQGFSKFGSYIGNGNADGTFVYTGFKPALVIFKKTSGTGGWNMFDTKRDPFNVQDQILRANATNAEASDSGYSDNDFLSNGFKLRQTWGEMNGSGATYIYMAFAEEPLVSTNGIPATAR